ncbi:sigma 54-interacting transcriptional regulator [Fodinisporobacter ferrooxydans]|uniref:Sigma 54-interacting transcriptional regulator n=1 Tax=Fodinisporobacter ferrooxydans TaxID=2901836 RepID=A0ABY4CNW7_9BACL|nr:sigma 54-interacting transcriptional regulator [Alicyclobacillaceae bacterium MYW30-H2]
MKSHERKTLALVTGTKMTLRALSQQLTDIFCDSDSIEIHEYALDEWIGDKLFITADLLLLSTEHLLEQATPYLDPACPLLIAKRVTNYHHIDQLLMLEEGTKVLLVNDHKETALESIESLMTLGVDHLQYIPYFPQDDKGQGMEDIEVAVTPGEVVLVPKGIRQIIDIGPRLLDVITIMEILTRFGLLETPNRFLSERYMKKIIELGKEMADATKRVTMLNRHVQQVLDGVNEGILAVNQQGKITIFNEILEQISRVPALRAIGKPLHQVITIPELIQFLTDLPDEETRLFQVEGKSVVVTRLPQEDGFIATFQNLKDISKSEQQWRKTMLNKGYIAKHTFHHIVGKSDAIQNVKQIAKKLARTDLTVLIEGESGTGKELFASAIHNESERKKCPFLAVNFSALSEDLVESELFGYEEGAFTGAKKGGKAGLFELAEGGTIFLDEIGDISVKIQARLLRVLQEKEVMRVGGNKITPVDVRVIAATNKNLLAMIQEGRFREDLYHRLKVLSLKLPPLRMRTSDIPILASHFLRQSSIRNIAITPEVMGKLCECSWFGNVRELKNAIEYMLAVSEGDELRLEDLPDSLHDSNSLQDPFEIQQDDFASLDPVWQEFAQLGDQEIYLALLTAIETLKKRGLSAGRRTLSVFLASRHLQLSEQQIRNKLDVLEKHGYILKTKGRSGASISAKGQRILWQNGLK